MQLEFEMTLERDGAEIPVTVTGDWYAASHAPRDCWGQATEPDEGAFFEIDSVKTPDGTELKLTEAEWGIVDAAAAKEVADDTRDHYPTEEDWPE